MWVTTMQGRSEREFYRGLKTVTCRPILPISSEPEEPEPGILISESLTPEQAEKFAQFALEAIKDKDFISARELLERLLL